MRKTLFATAALILLMTNPLMAQDQKHIYIMAGSVMPWHTERPYAKVYVGGDKLLTVQGNTDRDLIITAGRPDHALTENATVLLIDDQGNVVENLNVEVTPFGQPTATVAILGWSVYDRTNGDSFSKTTVYHCGPVVGCLDAAPEPSRKGPDNTTVTQYSNGSSATTRSWTR